MSVYLAKHNGKRSYRIDFVWKDPGEPKRRIRLWSKAKTQLEAEEEERQVQKTLSAKSHQEPKPLPADAKPTLAGVAPLYFAWAVLRRKPSYLEDQRSRYQQWILPALGSKPVDEITLLDKHNLANHMLLQHKSPSTINNTLGVIGSILSYALMARLVSQKLPCGFLPVTLKPRRYFTDNQYEKFLHAVRAEPLQGAILVAGETGLRLGEIRGLRWENIDFDEGTIKVCVSLWYDEPTLPKHNRIREVPMTQRLKEKLLLLKHKRGPYVFCGKYGAPWTTSYFDNGLRRIAKETGMQISWHGFRHTFCTRLLNRSVGLKAIQELAGHADLSTTQLYLHLDKKHLRRAISLLDLPPPD